ncbi:MAG TPA: hypothetical protein VMZ71_14005 [Gemmataceae bacterium]|nr:hypothetical protein [Gemmataceae bacterium]
MTTPAKLPAEVPDDEPEELGSSYELLFQTWVLLVLVVICFALVSYLLLFLSR